MALPDIARIRLSNQHIAGNTLREPQDVVAWMGAMQAQDYTMGKWAIGVRLPGATEDTIEQDIEQGRIIRTHILRPTWHFVAAGDIRWMIELSAPRLNSALQSFNKKLELTDTVFRKCHKLIEKALTGGRHLTRPELMAILQSHKIPTDDLRSNHIMFAAETSGLVCSGSRRGKQLTYALLDERVPGNSPELQREEAIARLTLRYFTSHGPATITDFAWWANLTLKEIKQGLDANKDSLHRVIINGQEYWMPDTADLPKSRNNVHLLPAFDEFMVSYKDRSASLAPALSSTVITANGIFKPMIVSKGKILGSWKRGIQKKVMVIEPDFFKAEEQLSEKALQPALKAYAAFLNQETIIRL
jgi:hypothetical protein